ncbi:MAG: hypothetical protein U0930_00455 [Pirellulales bacterium]
MPTLKQQSLSSKMNSPQQDLISDRIRLAFLTCCMLASNLITNANCFAQTANDYFGIQVVDKQTGRGVPLVRLRTTGAIDLWSDSNGWIAFNEPGLMDTSVYFSVESPGYSYPADGFGYRGVQLQTTPGKTAKIELNRDQLAQRLYRITGQGIYRDSQLLNQPYPTEVQQLSAGVIGQDSVQMVRFKDKLYWLWGDTILPNYPLGNFHTTAAITDSEQLKKLDPSRSLDFQYIVGNNGFPKKMLSVQDPGVVWLFGLIDVTDSDRDEYLVAHYSRHLELGKTVEHGIAVWDESKQQFEKRTTFDLSNKWRFPRGQAVRVQQEDDDYIYFTESFATVRVRAHLEYILDPDHYQSLAWDSDKQAYIWQKQRPPTTQKEEAVLLASGSMPASHARHQLRDIANDNPVEIHRSSIYWNAYRRKWIMIGCQLDERNKPSHLGEIWYSEASAVDGPWYKVVKVATHPSYTFYNPRHHQLLDRENGQIIYFEGTYTHQFSGNESQTPRYDYNQLLYRLDLSQLPDAEQFETVLFKR